MKSFLVIFALMALSSAQYRNPDPKTAAILQEARYLQGDGSFGSAYVQEDGTDFKEETTADGTRRGQYSYIDPNGKKITVAYTAGKDGFKVTGDHLPKAPVPLPVQAPAPQYNPSPRYNSIPQNNYNNNNNYYQPQQNFAPQQAIPDTPEVAQARREHFAAVEAARARAGQNDDNDDGQYREQQYNQQPQQQYNNYQQPQPQFNNYQQQPQFNNYQQPFTTTTEAAPRFFPSGRLTLNRQPDGFNFNFASQ